MIHDLYTINSTTIHRVAAVSRAHRAACPRAETGEEHGQESFTGFIQRNSWFCAATTVRIPWFYRGVRGVKGQTMSWYGAPSYVAKH